MSEIRILTIESDERVELIKREARIFYAPEDELRVYQIPRESRVLEVMLP